MCARLTTVLAKTVFVSVYLAALKDEDVSHEGGSTQASGCMQDGVARGDEGGGGLQQR